MQSTPAKNELMPKHATMFRTLSWGVFVALMLTSEPSFGWQFRDVTPVKPTETEPEPLVFDKAPEVESTHKEAPQEVTPQETAPAQEKSPEEATAAKRDTKEKKTKESADHEAPPKVTDAKELPTKEPKLVDKATEAPPAAPILNQATGERQLAEPEIFKLQPAAAETPAALVAPPAVSETDQDISDAGEIAAVFRDDASTSEILIEQPDARIAVEVAKDSDVVDEDTLAELALESRAEQQRIAETIDPDDPYWTGKALSQEVKAQVQDDNPEAIRAMRFNHVLVGKTSLSEVLRRWGQPFKVVRGKHRDIIKYRTKTFRQVDLTVADKTIAEILIHLREPLDPAHTASELSIGDIRPVPVPDEFGRVMGLAYPERGVMFSFRPDDPDTLVSKIHLEPINPEPFVLRAIYDFDRDFEQDLQDIEIALEMNPDYAKALWARASILEKVGRYQAALDAAEDAVHFDPSDDLYQLTHARLLSINGETNRAEKIVDDVLSRATAHPAHRAMASLQKGDLIANGPSPGYKDAMEHHLRAIDLAAPLANDREFTSRRLAKQVLVDAHLAVARNISRGKYQRQRQVVPKWLSRSRALVEELVTRDQGDPALRLKVYQHVLGSAADLENPDDPSRVLEDLLAEGRRLVETSNDPMDKSRLEWELGSALAEGVRLERLRGADRSALALADDALVLLQQSAAERQATPSQRYVVGRLYFQIGSLYAVHRGDHAEAVEWYAKATPMLTQDIPVGVQAHPRVHGETFISMGVSYWKQNRRERAIELTEQGAEILQHAVVEGLLPPETLAISYGNLASMHKQLGNGSDARAFAELANSLESSDTGTVTR